MVFEKPPFSFHLIYREHSPYALLCDNHISCRNFLRGSQSHNIVTDITVNCSVTTSLSQLPHAFAIRPVGLLAHVWAPILCKCRSACKHAICISAVWDCYYRLSNPSYMVPIGMITAITSVPTISAMNTMISGSIAASTLWVVISTSSS